MVWRETERVRARRRAVRDKVLREARALVASGGFDALQMAVLARRAHVAVGTVYRYFPSKAVLCAEVFAYVSQREVDVIAEVLAAPGPVPVRLESAVRLWCGRAQQGEVLARALLTQPVDPAVEEARLAYRAAYAGLFAAAIREGVTRGEVPDQDPEVTAACLVGALGEAVLGPREAPRGADAIDAITRFCLAAVGAPPAVRRAAPPSPLHPGAVP